MKPLLKDVTVSMLLMATLLVVMVHGTWTEWLADQVEDANDLHNFNVVADVVNSLDATRAVPDDGVNSGMLSEVSTSWMPPQYPQDVDGANSVNYRFQEVGVGEGEGGKAKAKGGGGGKGKSKGGGEGAKKAGGKGGVKPPPQFPLPPPMPPGMAKYPGLPYPYIPPSKDYLRKLGKEQYMNMWRSSPWQGIYDPSIAYPTTAPNYYAALADPYARGRDLSGPHARLMKWKEQMTQAQNPIFKMPVLGAPSVVNQGFAAQLPPVQPGLPGQPKQPGSRTAPINPYMYALNGPQAPAQVNGPPAFWPHRSLPDWAPWYKTSNSPSNPLLDPSITPHNVYYAYANNGGAPYIPTSYPYTAYYGSGTQAWSPSSTP